MSRTCLNCGQLFSCAMADDGPSCAEWAPMDDLQVLEAALREAMEWNWISDDAEDSIPTDVRKKCEDAIKLCEERRKNNG